MAKFDSDVFESKKEKQLIAKKTKRLKLDTVVDFVEGQPIPETVSKKFHNSLKQMGII